MSCPSEEQLAGYLLDSQAPDLAAVREHVNACAACRAWIDEVRREDEDLQHVRRVLIESQPTAAGDSVAVNPDATTFSPTAVFAASPDFQEYEIIEELGRGGMGAVYLAMQKSTKRKVALKVLLEGPFASAAAKRRFEREVELAAQLQHPHIVTILESGIASGRYYFAMQYVEGQRLDVYFAPRPMLSPPPGAGANVKPAISAPSPDGPAGGRGGNHRESVAAAGTNTPASATKQVGATGSTAARQFTIRDKLALFQKICEAVNYAHQRGVIHRDLKPSNIIVDAQGEPHILDFGLAKVADPEAEREPQALSVTGQLMGTLPYMSPEQAMGLHHDVDIRSDVYSLGVILYELLTRQFPYSVVGRIPDVLKNIIETPPRPPRNINHEIDDEVETITLKALCKERERRYQSAGELARDLKHYLAGEPIEAKRDSTLYVLGKMLRRYRVPVGVAAVFLLLAFVGAFLLTAWQARAREANAAREAAQLLQASLDNPGHVLSEVRRVAGDVRRNLSELVARHLVSPAAPERVMGSPAGLLLRPDVFWKSVDGGPLWEHGEWLEIAAMAASPVAGPPPQDMVASMLDRARNGSDRQKYVALCLLGEICRRHPSLAMSAADVFIEAAKTASHPGVAAAGFWAARRIGRKIEPPLSQSLYSDELTGLTFVRVPAARSFRRGSGLEDPDRLEDEIQPPQGVDLEPFYLSMTEVTLEAFAPFYEKHGQDTRIFGPVARGEGGSPVSLPAQYERTSSAERPYRAVHTVSLVAAQRFCDWLTSQGLMMQPARRYRLPSEDQWEWACRGGSTGRFCYGNEERYAAFFAKCNGAQEGQYMVAERMPNFYGLFDMHGNVWEWLDDAVYLYDPATGQPLMTHIPGAGDFVRYTLRGGAFYSPAVRCRSTQRTQANDFVEVEYYGFRVVMELLP